MGNTSIDTKEQSLFAEIGQIYQEVKRESRGVVLLHKQSQVTFLLKQYTFGTEQIFRMKLKSLQLQISQGPKEYIISPIKCQPKIFNSFCSTNYKIYAIFEYPQVTLREEIMARQKQNKNFEQTELWSILQSCTNALGDLKPFVSINPTQIFINPDGHLKVIHDDLVEENYRAIINNHIYYAPQKLKNFNKIDTDLGLRKQSIFSMGMTLLQAAQLSGVDFIYDYEQGSLDESQLDIMIQSLTNKYSPDFIQILANILEVNPNRRASLMEVQQILNLYWNAQECGEQQHQQPQQVTCDKVLQHQPTLSEKNFNKMVQNSEKKSQKMQEKLQQLSLPEETSSYKLQQPLQNEPLVIQTPKNIPTSFKQNAGLYTDPKLLEMIRRDLQDIHKLKQSHFYETAKYNYIYPQTESILNSIRNMDNQHIINSSSNTGQTKTNEIENTILGNNQKISEFKQLKTNRAEDHKDTFAQKNYQEISAPKVMMKKNNKENLVFTIQTYQNGRRYEGMTLNGKKHGQGKLIFEDAAYYEGQFKQDKMNGKGTLYYEVGHPAYDGQWCNDQFHGFGVLFNESPQQLDQMYDFRDFNEIDDYWVKYEGHFSYDNKYGNGKLYLTNNQILEGQFKNDYVDGQANFYRLNGQLIYGVWQTNNLIQIINEQQ